MILGAIFDFDGTLFDSMFIWNTAGETYLRSMGKEPKEDSQCCAAIYSAFVYEGQWYLVAITMTENMTAIVAIICMFRFYGEQRYQMPQAVEDKFYANLIENVCSNNVRE